MGNSDALWLSIVSGLIFLAYLDHLVHSFALWRRERSFRAFRNAFIAVMLQVGLLRIWIGATVRAVPSDQWLGILQAITAPILTMLLLSGAIVLFYTWRQDP